MIRKIVATELIVRDMDACKAFYRDTLGLQLIDDQPDVATFKIGDLYFFLLSAAEAARMIGGQSLRFSFEGTPRSLHAAGVDDVDALYADLRAKGSTSWSHPPTSPGDCVPRTSPILKATSGRSTSPSSRRARHN